MCLLPDRELLRTDESRFFVSFACSIFSVFTKTLNSGYQAHPTDSNPRKVSLQKPCLCRLFFHGDEHSTFLQIYTVFWTVNRRRLQSTV